MSYIIKNLGLVDYQATWEAMREFTETRTPATPDEYWIVTHHPIFTLGLAGKEEHLLNKNHNIPIIRCDRGGQVTYHGPGQIVIYTLIDLKRSSLSIRDLVIRLELGIINFLASVGVTAHGDRAAPGIYIAEKKIASIGLKVRKSCTYHGISFNADMDLTPFESINVCGFSGLRVTQLSDLIPITSMNPITQDLVNHLTRSIYSLPPNANWD